MIPYPKALRTRVVAAVEQGDMTIGEVAAVCRVGKTFVKKMLRLQRAGADLAIPVKVGILPDLRGFFIIEACRGRRHRSGEPQERARWF